MEGVLNQTQEQLANTNSKVKKERTQDLKVITSNFEVIPELAEFTQPRPEWLQDFSNDGDYLKELVDEDKVYSYYKFSSKNNYKVNY